MKGPYSFKTYVLIFNLPWPLIAQVNWRSPEIFDAIDTRVSTASDKAVVVTANPLASAAALKTLEQGGTEMDAVITAQTVLAVVEPQSSGLGGGALGCLNIPIIINLFQKTLSFSTHKIADKE